MATQKIQLLVDEFDDPVRRLCNGFYRIVDSKGDEIVFRANSAQQQLIENMHNLNIILKARQWGMTTVIDVLGLDQALFNQNFSVGIIAHTLEDVKKIFRTKVKFPWSALPADMRNQIGGRNDSANEMTFGNGSAITVGTSLRSSTQQFLHISEYGKICNMWPEKAREIRTGALNTLHVGQIGFIESTAEGMSGDFFEKSMTALAMHEAGDELSPMDWKFHFFPWWGHPEYCLPPEEVLKVTVDATSKRYFRRLEVEHGINLTPGQQAWYIKKAEEQRGDMRREYPSYPKEAFEVAIDGAYYAKQMAQVRRNQQISMVPHDPRKPVHTAWDLGRNDTNAIWFFQDGDGGTFRMLQFYENNGEAMQFYGRYMQKLAEENEGWYYGTTYLPHDADQVDYTREDGKKRVEILEDMGFSVLVLDPVKTNSENGEGVQAVRDVLPLCFFDKEGCTGRPKGDEYMQHTGGVESLDAYQKEWNPNLGTYRDRPLHNWASHGAKAFETFARGHRNKASIKKHKTRNRGSWRTL